MTSTELVSTRVPGPAAPSAARTLISPASAALALATPAVTTALLALARHWSDSGARHSVGDLVPLAIGTGMGLSGAAWSRAADDSALTGTCLAVAGVCVAVGTMSYPAGLAEPLITWTLATVAGWVFTRRPGRARQIVGVENGQRQADRDHQEHLAAIGSQTAIGVATIRGQAQVETARVTAIGLIRSSDARVEAAQWRVQQLEEAWAHRRALDEAPAPLALESAEYGDDLYALAGGLELERR
jgi:hypothetical protein